MNTNAATGSGRVIEVRQAIAEDVKPWASTPYSA